MFSGDSQALKWIPLSEFCFGYLFLCYFCWLGLWKLKFWYYYYLNNKGKYLDHVVEAFIYLLIYLHLSFFLRKFSVAFFYYMVFALQVKFILGWVRLCLLLGFVFYNKVHVSVSELFLRVHLLITFLSTRGFWALIESALSSSRYIKNFRVHAWIFCMI